MIGPPANASPEDNADGTSTAKELDSATATPAAPMVAAAFDPELGPKIKSTLLDPQRRVGSASRPTSAQVLPDIQGLVQRGLQQALQQPKYSKGVIIDSLCCPWLPTAATARCFLQALGLVSKTAAAAMPAELQNRGPLTSGKLPSMKAPGAAAAAAAAAPAGTRPGSRGGVVNKGGKAGPGLAPVPEPIPVPEQTVPDIWEGNQKVRPTIRIHLVCK